MSIFSNMKDMMSMAQKAKEIQANLKVAQEEIQNYEITEKDTSAQVSVTIRGDFSIKKVEIKPDCPALKDRPMLEEAIQDATNHAIHALQVRIKDRMKEATGGIDLPGLI